VVKVKSRVKDVLTLQELTKEDILDIISLAYNLKLEFYSGKRIVPLLHGKTLAMIFQKPSTRTRISFENAMYQLGGYALYLSWNELQLGRGETIADTARVLSRYVDGIMARVYSHKDIEELAKYSTVPVINGLSDLHHPCQALSDLLTIWEKKRRLEGIKLAYVGDGNNVCNSLLIATTKVGMNIAVATPKKYRPPDQVVKMAEENAAESGSEIVLTEDPQEAVSGADVVYTDVWISMGFEKEAEERMKVFKPYQVNSQLMERAKKDAIFMHCLPAKRGLEVTDEVIDGPRSVVWDQAENRLHAQKALLAVLLRG